MHPSTLPSYVTDRMMQRRGKVTVFDNLEPARTAVVVVDMQNVFCEPGAAIEVPVAREIVPNINRLADAARTAGSLVAWVQMTIPDMKAWPVFLDSIVAPGLAQHVLDSLKPGTHGHKLWPKMDAREGDLFVTKNRFSAFLPTACELPAILRKRGIDTILVTGTLTNVCCESSARDAMMLDFRPIMVADANAARNDDEHMATLITFIQSFGDVRSTDDVIGMLDAGKNASAA